MKVFKFGGASVKDAQGVRNVARVLEAFKQDDLLIVVSAMGKTTNALEEVVKAYREGRNAKSLILALQGMHAMALGEVAPTDQAAALALAASFDELKQYVAQPVQFAEDRDYDHIVSFGEVWSTLIVSAYLNSAGFANKWVDTRKIITTDGRHRAANVKWDRLEENCATHLPSFAAQPHRIVTQGFIGSTEEGITTTLGREGSDFSAAIFAYALGAESVTIWKDVPGMFNADPNKFPDTRLLEHISYKEAIELSYFGASVIHPRTLQPLQRKGIPLYVRSFADIGAKGSTIDHRSDNDSLVPSFILKPGQLLISITPRDLSFVVEENLSSIFKRFAEHSVRIELMQNSAVAFTVCVDDTPRARQLIGELHREYEVRYNEGCELITVRHFDEATLIGLLAGREPLLEQRSRVTARFVVK